MLLRLLLVPVLGSACETLQCRRAGGCCSLLAPACQTCCFPQNFALVLPVEGWASSQQQGRNSPDVQSGKNLHPAFLVAQSSSKVTVVIGNVFSPSKPKYLQLN